MFDGEVFADFVAALPARPPVPRRGPRRPTARRGLLAGAVAHRRRSSRHPRPRACSATASQQAIADPRHRLPARTPPTPTCTRRLADGELRLDDYHRALLRLVYRLLFLLRRRGPRRPARTRRRPRRRAGRYARLLLHRPAAPARAAPPRHHARRPVGRPSRVVIDALGDEDGRPELGLPGLGGLFDHRRRSTSLDRLPRCANERAARRGPPPVASSSPRANRKRRRRLPQPRRRGARLHLRVACSSSSRATTRSTGPSRLETLAGNERKTTGSYYTPTALIDLLLDDGPRPGPRRRREVRTHRAETSGAAGDHGLRPGLRLRALPGRRRPPDRQPRSPRSGPARPSPPRPTLQARAARRRRPLHLRRRPQPDGRRARQGQPLAGSRSSPAEPLSFLDAHIKVGNALLGATPALLAAGIPDDAFDPIEGDDKKCAAALKKRNSAERDAAHSRHRQGDLFDQAGLDVSNTGLRKRLRAIAAARRALTCRRPPRQAATRRTREAPRPPSAARTLADAWCAAFVQRKVPDAPPITHDTLARRRRRHRPHPVADRGRRPHRPLPVLPLAPGVPRHLTEAPDAGASTATGWLGGFTCIVGNPPWERVKLQEQEFFASRDPEIADAPPTPPSARS